MPLLGSSLGFVCFLLQLCDKNFLVQRSKSKYTVKYKQNGAISYHQFADHAVSCMHINCFV